MRNLCYFQYAQQISLKNCDDEIPLTKLLKGKRHGFNSNQQTSYHQTY